MIHFIHLAFEMNTHVTHLSDSLPQDLNPSDVLFSMLERPNFSSGPVFLEVDCPILDSYFV